MCEYLIPNAVSFNISTELANQLAKGLHFDLPQQIVVIIRCKIVICHIFSNTLNEIVIEMKVSSVQRLRLFAVLAIINVINCDITLA